MKHKRGQQYQHHHNQQKQLKKKQIQKDDDNTVTSKITQESPFGSKQFECTLIDDEYDTYKNNTVLIPTRIILRMHDKKTDFEMEEQMEAKVAEIKVP